MKLSQLLKLNNPIALRTSPFVFYKVFVLFALVVRLGAILYNINFYESLPQIIIPFLQPKDSFSMLILISMIYVILSVLVLMQKNSSTLIRLSLSTSYCISHFLSAHSGYVINIEYSLLMFFLIFSYVPQDKFINEDKDYFNELILAMLVLSLLPYTIAGIHKLYNFNECLISWTCLNKNSYLEFQIFSLAVKKGYKIPFEAILLGLSTLQKNLIYFLVATFELLSVFSILSRKALKIQLLGLCLFHVLTALFMRAFFYPMIATHLILLTFCFQNTEKHNS